MTTSQLISHLQALVAADPAVADLPVCLNDRDDNVSDVRKQDVTLLAAGDSHWMPDAHVRIQQP